MHCRLKLGRGQLLGKALNLLWVQDKTLEKASLQAQTSAVHVDVTRSGLVTTHRLDFLIGSTKPGKGGSRADHTITVHQATAAAMPSVRMLLCLPDISIHQQCKEIYLFMSMAIHACSSHALHSFFVLRRCKW